VTVSVRNPARERLAAGELCLGIGIRQCRSVDIAPLMHTAGFDWLFLDLEHGPMSLQTASEISVTALAVGIAPIVRVPRAQYSMATRALDGGALGIVMPHVDTAEEAREVVDHLRFPPDGHRSVAGGPPQLGFRNVGTRAAAPALNAATLLVVMLETPRAIDNAEAIAAVPGIDALLIGTNDLTAEMGLPGELGSDAVVKAYERVIAACRKHGKVPGMGGVYSEDLLRRYIGLGMRLILCGGDGGLLLAAATQRAGFVRGVGK
jgi:2-keto-3-deoxy-L-rhamnonate aldolase RhmA